MKKVSVIVPVYNVESYLKKCLDSLVNQTMASSELDIIIVNDGSPDNSQTIIDEYTAKYDNIRSFIKENGGLSDARNYGIALAQGKYITFLDSDDWVDLEYYQRMHDKAISENFDIVLSDVKFIYPNRTHIASAGVKKDVIDDKQLKQCFVKLFPVACNKLYKQELFSNGLKFKKGVYFEDVEFMLKLLPHIKSIGYVGDCFYHYLQRDNAITSVFDEKLYDFIHNFNGIYEHYVDNDLMPKYSKELEYAYTRYSYATFLNRCLNYNKNDYLKALNFAINNVKSKYKHSWRNKYFYFSAKGIYLLIFNRFVGRLLYKMKRKK